MDFRTKKSFNELLHAGILMRGRFGKICCGTLCLSLLCSSNVMAAGMPISYGTCVGGDCHFSIASGFIAENFDGVIDNDYSEISSLIIGGYPSDLAGVTDIKNNKITINATDLTTKLIPIGSFKVPGIIAGWATDGASYQNSLVLNGELTLSDSPASYSLIAGKTDNGSASQNSIFIKNSINTDSSVYIYGGYSTNGVAKDNLVMINTGTASNIYGGYSENSEANNNRVYLDNLTVSKDLNIYGGYSEESEANNNRVYLDNLIVSTDLNVYGGYSEHSKANNNRVYLGNLTLEKI